MTHDLETDDAGAPGEPPAELTVDEIARAAGMTVRTVRAHQNRGLLPPPRLVGRTGYYGPSHLARLRRIADLQDRGYSLAAISDVLEDDGAPARQDHADGVAAVAATPWVSEDPVVLSPAEVTERLGRVGEDEQLIQRLVAAKLVEHRDDGRVTVLSPAVMDSGEALVAAGASAESVIALQERMRDAMAALAADVLKVAHSEVLIPGLAAAESDTDVAAVIQLMLDMRPLAFQAANALLAQGFDAALQTTQTIHPSGAEA